MLDYGKIENEYDLYEFGEGVTVLGSSSWDLSDLWDATRIVYVAYDDDPPGSDSHRLSFHVRKIDDEALDVYALSMDTGNEIGQRGGCNACV